MIIIKNNFTSEEEKAALVRDCERHFEAQLTAVSEYIKQVKNLHIIALAGPTCSGKTTTSAKLTADLIKMGMTVRVVSIDDFFRDRGERELTINKKVDYDTIEAIDFPYLAECVDNISRRRPAVMPVYDFITGTRASTYTLETGDNDVIIFEGIQALYPDISALFASHNSRSVYIRASEPLFIDDKNNAHDRYFAPNDLRLMRRIVRDHRTRGATPEFTFFIWQSVRENEDKNIFPYEPNADITVNSTLAYEANMIKPYILPLLDTISPESAFKAAADSLADKLAPLEVIDYSYVPDTSVYKEFLG